MKTKLVNVRMPEKLFNEGKNAVEEGCFSNFQELIKEAVRDKVNEVKKEQWLINLEKNFGSTKNMPKKPLTKEIKEKIALDIMNNPQKQKEIARRFGL